MCAMPPCNLFKKANEPQTIARFGAPFGALPGEPCAVSFAVLVLRFRFPFALHFDHLRASAYRRLRMVSRS